MLRRPYMGGQLDARQVTSSAQAVLVTHQPPSATGEAVTPLRHLGGTLLVVGVTRGLRSELSSVLPAVGLFPVYSSSDVLALELMSRGSLFDAVLIEVPPDTDSEPPLAVQLRARHPNVAVFVVSRHGSDCHVFLRGSSAANLEDSDATTLAQTILAAIAHEGLQPGRTSGVLPLSSRVPTERLFPEQSEITG
ncbi:MAG: hypothetical protein QM784_39710 [Polyangiaceae bacterium]